MNNIIQAEQVISGNIHVYTYTYMHVTINEERDHEFEKSREAWEEDREEMI